MHLQSEVQTLRSGWCRSFGFWQDTLAWHLNVKGKKTTMTQDTNNTSCLKPPHIASLCLLSRSAGGSWCSLSCRELWKDGGFTQLSAGIEVTVGFELRGSAQAAGIRGLSLSPAAASLHWEWSFLYWGFSQADQRRT